jgi:hypothetical protein
MYSRHVDVDRDGELVAARPPDVLAASSTWIVTAS